MILDDIRLAIGQLGDPRFRRVLGFGIGLTIALLVAVYAVFLGGLNWLLPDSVSVPWFGEVTWIDDLLTGGSILLMLLLSVFLMIPVASAFTGLFLDDVTDAVEARHFPNLTPAPRIGIAAGLADSLNYLSVLIVANLAALILYLIFLPAAPLIFLGAERISAQPGVFPPDCRPPPGPRRGQGAATATCRASLAGRDHNGAAADDPGGKPAGPNSGGGGVHASVSPGRGGTRRLGGSGCGAVVFWPKPDLRVGRYLSPESRRSRRASA